MAGEIAAKIRNTYPVKKTGDKFKRLLFNVQSWQNVKRFYAVSNI
jgi:hypothetical protein